MKRKKKNLQSVALSEPIFRGTLQAPPNGLRWWAVADEPIEAVTQGEWLRRNEARQEKIRAERPIQQAKEQAELAAKRARCPICTDKRFKCHEHA